jgi:AcrR family transcriptional regulator
MSSASRPYGDPATRHRILDATWNLIERRRSAVTLAEAAEAAGVTRQAVYLHFGDRAGLMVALVDHIDLSLDSTQLRAHVFGGPTGVESLHRWIQTMSWYTKKIDAITRVLEYGQYDDDALAAAWRNRMGRRRDDIIRTIVERIAAEGNLASGWAIERAVDLIYVITMPGPWRELTIELGWTPEHYAEQVTELVNRSFLR